MKNYSHIRSAIYGQPWMITKEGLDLVSGIVENKLAGIEPNADLMARISLTNEQKQGSDYVVRNGVAIIQVFGPIIPRATMFSKVSGVTSYQEISDKLNDALSRLDIAAVLFQFGTPGGSVLGCFECGTEIYEARKSSTIPIIGFADGQACSAGYNLLAQCDAAFCSEGSVVGSIGVISQMDNTDRAEKNMGNDVVVMRSEELKAPGVGPMTPNQMMSLQAKMMKFDSLFDESVKRGRPGINIEKVSTGESWVGQDAVNIGLCDGVCTIDDLISEYGANILR